MDGESGKTFIDRGIQTEPPRHLSRSEDAKALNLHEPMCSLPPDDAYNQISPLTLPKREHKLSQPAFQKPSEINISNKRVVSLPETSPPSRIKPDTIRERVVSMSEHVKVSLTSSADNSMSSDCFESSIDSSQSLTSSDIHLSSSGCSRSRPRRSLASSVYPQTPSPPSSPESVMIIGNNMQVPSSFLRQKIPELSKYEDGDEDEDSGWITWPSSPPRAIPALHGPLSLPYARCPSGAEGTVIEGEDMSRTIWGLGNDSAPIRGHPHIEPKVKGHFSNGPSIQQHELASRSPRAELPTRFRSLSNVPTSNQDTLPTIIESPPARPSDDTLYNSSLDHDGAHNLRRNHDVLARGPSMGRKPVQGLGLVFPDSSRPSGPEQRDIPAQQHLKASAPVFIPGRQLAQQSQPRVSFEPSLRSHTIISRPPLPAIDLACEYRAQQEGKTPLLTPPSSSSTQWSPYLATPLSLSGERAVDLWQCEDAAEELRRFIYDRIGQQNLSPSDLKQISELARSMNLDRCRAYPTSSTFPTSKYSPAASVMDLAGHHPGPPPSAPLPSIPSRRSQPGGVLMTPPSPEISALSRSVAQPRSVPFARLLQRRLSVVPEEPSSRSSSRAEHPTSSPRPERTAFGGTAEAQHYKPYFAHTAGQKTPRLPDISNFSDSGAGHVRLRSSSSNGEPFTAGRLEVGEYVHLPRNSAAIPGRSFASGVYSSHSRGDTTRKVKGASAMESFPEGDAPEGSKENGTTIGRSISAGSNKNGANHSGKEAGRKRAKAKPKKQDSNSTPLNLLSGYLDPPTGDPWLAGPALEAWLA